MNKRTLFVITTILSSVTLFILVWLEESYVIDSYAIGLYIVWITLFSVLSLFVLKGNFEFPEHIIYSLVVLLYGVGELLMFLSLYDGLTSYSRYLVLLIIAVFKYVLYLTLNIFNAATVRTVPLLKAAKKILLVIAFINAVIWAYFVVTFVSSIELSAWIWGVYACMLSISYLYLGRVQVVDDFYAVRTLPFKEAGIITLLQILMVTLTSSWSVPLVVRIVYWALSLIVLILIIQGKMNRSLSRRGLRELTMLTWVLFLMLLISGLR